MATPPIAWFPALFYIPAETPPPCKQFHPPPGKKRIFHFRLLRLFLMRINLSVRNARICAPIRMRCPFAPRALDEASRLKNGKLKAEFLVRPNFFAMRFAHMARILNVRAVRLRAKLGEFADGADICAGAWAGCADRGKKGIYLLRFLGGIFQGQKRRERSDNEFCPPESRFLVEEYSWEYCDAFCACGAQTDGGRNRLKNYF